MIDWEEDHGDELIAIAGCLKLTVYPNGQFWSFIVYDTQPFSRCIGFGGYHGTRESAQSQAVKCALEAAAEKAQTARMEQRKADEILVAIGNR